MSTLQRTPSQAQVIRRALALFAADLYVCRPGQIQKVDNATGLVSVKPLLKELAEDASGDTTVEPLPVVPGCVLWFPQGGDFVDTWPVKQGDACWLVFADRSLALWQDGNGDTDPVLQTRHDLMSGAVCFVGGRPKAKFITEWDPDRRVIGKQGGPRIALSDDMVHLGVDHQEDAPAFAARGDKTKDEISALRDTVNSLVSAFNQHVHQVSTAGSPFSHTGVTQPIQSQATSPAAVGDVSATKVKVK